MSASLTCACVGWLSIAQCYFAQSTCFNLIYRALLSLHSVYASPQKAVQRQRNAQTAADDDDAATRTRRWTISAKVRSTTSQLCSRDSPQACCNTDPLKAKTRARSYSAHGLRPDSLFAGSYLPCLALSFSLHTPAVLGTAHSSGCQYTEPRSRSPPPFFFVTTSRRRDFMWVSASCLNVGWDTTATTCINHIPRPHWRILWFFPAQDFTG